MKELQKPSLMGCNRNVTELSCLKSCRKSPKKGGGVLRRVSVKTNWAVIADDAPFQFKVFYWFRSWAGYNLYSFPQSFPSSISWPFNPTPHCPVPLPIMPHPPSGKRPPWRCHPWGSHTPHNSL